MDETEPSGEFTLAVTTENAAFEDKPYETARILREVADRIERGHDAGVIWDVNGNRVGEFDFST